MPPFPGPESEPPPDWQRPGQRECPNCAIAIEPEVLGLERLKAVRWLRCRACGHVWSESL